MVLRASGNRLYDESGSPINSANPLPVTLGSDPFTVTISAAVSINTTTAVDLVKPKSLVIDNITMNTISAWQAHTLTSQIYGFTLDARGNTTTANAPKFSFAINTTSTYNTLDSGDVYYDDVILPTNTVFYFNVSSQTGSVIQLNKKI